MSTALLFKLPVRVYQHYESRFCSILRNDGTTLASGLPREEADAIVAALNGYEAMREACQGLIKSVVARNPSDFAPGGVGFTCPHMRAIDAALNPPGSVPEPQEIVARKCEKTGWQVTCGKFWWHSTGKEWLVDCTPDHGTYTKAEAECYARELRAAKNYPTNGGSA